ncbi:MAG: methyltransferase domain-containing protein [Frankiaceae bacterium]|nr:methyltransferase domain-containing protein [Frankiaceae bacterium]MBV9872022.1 methyltransferase domain-containing protein [Frankiaceae bacterium]
MTATFDPVQFKTTTRAQWEDAAEAWHRWGPAIETWTGEATKAMLDAAGVTTGSSVLDVAAGAGGQSLIAARRVGPNGRVVATDISPSILTFAAKQAAEEGITCLETVEADGEQQQDTGLRGLDAAISRLGLIYFPDQVGALRGIRATLRRGGRFATIVYSTPDRNGFFSVPVGIIRKAAGLPAPGPGLPGPFSMGAPGVAEQKFADAGYSDIHVTAIDSPVRMASAAECLRFEKESFGALHQMLSGLAPEEREAAWAEVAEALTQFETAAGFVGPCELLVVSGAA